MELSVSHEDGYVLAKTSGPIDESALDSFRNHLHPLVRRRGTMMILDLSGSTRITSAGIARLVLLVTDANTNSSRVIIAAPSPFISGVFRVSGLERFFEIVCNVADAVDMLTTCGRSQLIQEVKC